jgi:acetolactate synthase-1/2/3 large subunit
MKASDLFVKALENEGVEYIFAIPGEENLDLLDSLSRSNIKLILTRHEQAAGFMAATVGRLTGKPGVCLSTLGPGATNLVTAAAYAQLGGMPMVMITGQKPIKKSRQGQFQIIDVVEMMRPLTKFTRQIGDATTIPANIREAFRLAMEERPGAVHLELPENVAAEEVEDSCIPLPIHRVQRPYPDPVALEKATTMIQNAKAPLLLVGAAANRKRTRRALTNFIDSTGIPFFNTQMGVGVIDERHPLYLGTAALSANDVVHQALEHADLIINVGHDIVEKPPFVMERDGCKVLHINFSSAMVDAVYFPQHEVVGDIANTMRELSQRASPSEHWDFSDFLRVKNYGDSLIDKQALIGSFPLTPPRLVADLRAAMPDDGIVCLDNGLYKLWFARNYRAHKPNTLLLDNALATMGAGLPAAIAAKTIKPGVKVVAVCGDGGFMMNAQELETAVRLGLDLVIIVLNDSAYGMIKWKQSEGHKANFGLDFTNPDFVALAQAHGAQGHRVSNADQLIPLLTECLNGKGVHLIDVPFEYESTNSQIKVNSMAEILPEEKTTEAAAIGAELAATVEPAAPLSAGHKMLSVYSPHDQSLIGQLPLATNEEMLAALERAHSLYLNRDQWLPAHRRIAILERLVGLMEEHKGALIATAISEGGKPYKDTVVEVERAIQGVKLGVAAIQNTHGEQVPMGLTPAADGRLAMTIKEPIGVVVSLSAFNHPLNLIVHQTVPALVAGCPVIVKPAGATPYSCLAFVKLLHQAGLPQEWCQALILERKDAEQLATDARVAYLSFIGSAKVGWHLRSKLAAGTRCGLEHGGVAPVVIDRSSANPEQLDELVAPLVKGAFYHAGQVCVSVKRIYVPKESALEFAQKLANAANALVVGDPADSGTAVGPLITMQEADRVHSWVQEAVAAGAQLLCGGTKVVDAAGLPTSYYAPTVLLNPPSDAKVSCEEIFGPVVCVYSYEGLDDAIAASNSLPYAFQAAVFSKDLDAAMYAVTRLKATAVMVNDHTAFRVDWMPFGGSGVSGMGLGGIAHSAREMSQEKLMVIKSQGLR